MQYSSCVSAGRGHDDYDDHDDHDDDDDDDDKDGCYQLTGALVENKNYISCRHCTVMIFPCSLLPTASEW